MDHALTEGQALLQRAAADFFAREFPLDRIREFRTNPGPNERDLWKQICAMGWNASAFPEEVGGYPGSFTEAAVILEQIGRAAAPTPLPHSTLAAGLALAAAGNPLAAAIAEGSAVVIAAPTVPGVPAPTMNSDNISGTATAVRWTTLATHYLLPGGGGYALVEAGPAVSSARLDSAGLEPLGRVDLKRAPVAARFDSDFARNLELNGSAACAVVLAGASQRALDVAVAYMKERRQFGKPIGAFQALQHRAADMAIENEVGRYLAFKAASLHGTAGFERNARYAKAYTSEASLHVCREAIQMHGGVGFVDEHKSQLFYRLCSDLSNAYGNAGQHREAVTAMVLAGQGQ
ncbi:MAG: acyl-CoA dehydrogenase family protein [Hyphomicrobiales bacterium]